MCTGSEFQITGAAKENERLPLADFMLGTTSRFFPSERSDPTGTCRCNNSDRYVGWLFSRTLNVRVADLNSIRLSTGSQRFSWRTMTIDADWLSSIRQVWWQELQRHTRNAKPLLYRRWTKILWGIISKAAERSSKTNAVTFCCLSHKEDHFLYAVEQSQLNETVCMQIEKANKFETIQCV